MKQLVIDKIIESNSTEDLCDLLNIDVHELIQAAAEKILNEMPEDKILGYL